MLTGRGQITTRQSDFDGIERALRDGHLGLGYAQAFPGRLGGIVCCRNVARRQACLGGLGISHPDEVLAEIGGDVQPDGGCRLAASTSPRCAMRYAQTHQADRSENVVVRLLALGCQRVEFGNRSNDVALQQMCPRNCLPAHSRV